MILIIFFLKIIRVVVQYFPSRLAKYPKYFSNFSSTGADGIHGAGLQIHEDGAGHVATAGGLVVVNVDALQLKVRVTVVPNTKSRFWSKKNLNSEAKIKILGLSMTAISNF